MSKKQILDGAREAGKKAKLAGKARSYPGTPDYPVKKVQDAWLEGYDSVKVIEPVAEVHDPNQSICPCGKCRSQPDVKFKSPEVRVPVVEMKNRSVFLGPKDQMPETYALRREPAPCQWCRCVYLAEGQQAVILQGTNHDYAYLLCRNPKCPGGPEGEGKKFKRRLA